MRTNDKTHSEMIAKLHKMTATKVAEQLAAIQPLDGRAGRIFALEIPEIKWSEWRRTTSIWPRRSINGNVVFGRINKRSRPEFVHSDGIRQTGRIREFATDKELFHQRLKNGKT